MGFALGLFELGYESKAAISILGSLDGIALATWLLSEFTVLLLARIAMDNWRFATAIGDSAGISMMMHTGEFFLLLRATSPLAHPVHPHARVHGLHPRTLSSLTLSCSSSAIASVTAQTLTRKLRRYCSLHLLSCACSARRVRSRRWTRRSARHSSSTARVQSTSANLSGTSGQW